MLKTRVLVGLAVGSLVLLGNLVPAWAAPPPSIRDMLAFEPKQKGVVISTPAADEITRCVTPSRRRSWWQKVPWPAPSPPSLRVRSARPAPSRSRP